MKVFKAKLALFNIRGDANTSRKKKEKSFNQQIKRRYKLYVLFYVPSLHIRIYDFSTKNRIVHSSYTKPHVSIFQRIREESFIHMG